MRPRIIVIRVGEFLEELESKKEQPAKVEVFRNGKFVKVGGTRVGYTYKGEWKWTNHGAGLYDAATLTEAKEYA